MGEMLPMSLLLDGVRIWLLVFQKILHIESFSRLHCFCAILYSSSYLCFDVYFVQRNFWMPLEKFQLFMGISPQKEKFLVFLIS